MVQDGHPWTVPFTADSDVEVDVEILGIILSTSTSDLTNFCSFYNCGISRKTNSAQKSCDW